LKLALCVIGVDRALMHHKFLVGLDNHRQPQWVVTGSFNATVKSVTNIENAMAIQSTHVAEAYYREYLRLHQISKALARMRV
jgi:hypothetical protein